MPKGVRLDAERNNYVASAIIDGKRRHIGTYDTQDEAVIAREKYLLDPYFYMAQPNSKDVARLKRFNEILKATKKVKTLAELSEIIQHVTPDTLRLDTKGLRKFGYIEQSTIRSGIYNQKISTFLALKKEFVESDLKLMQTARREYVPKSKSDEENTEIIKGARVIRFEGSSKQAIELASKLVETYEIDRANRKSPKNYVSGSSLSAAV